MSKLRNNPEYTIHVAFVKHLDTAFPGLFFFHVPNENKDATSGFHKKRMGVKAGVSDLIFSWCDDNGKLCMGALELKAPKGKASDHQSNFLQHAFALGWKTGVARSVKEAHQRLLDWGLVAKHGVIKEADIRSHSEKIQAGIDFWRPG